jgi:hypothetical protein
MRHILNNRAAIALNHEAPRNNPMKKIMIIAAIAASLGACTQQEERIGGGALIGAGTGAVIGGLATGRAGGALAGAAIGGVAGGAIGGATSPTRTCVGRDEYGRRFRYDC